MSIIHMSLPGILNILAQLRIGPRQIGADHRREGRNTIPVVICAQDLRHNVFEIKEFCLLRANGEFHIPNTCTPHPHKSLLSLEGAPFGIHPKPVFSARNNKIIYVSGNQNDMAFFYDCPHATFESYQSASLTFEICAHSAMPGSSCTWHRI